MCGEKQQILIKESVKIFSVLLTGENILILLSYVYQRRNNHCKYHLEYKI